MLNLHSISPGFFRGNYLVMEAMKNCKFAIFPSVSPECASTVAREAMSQRKAIIASSIGGLKEAVVDGETGILVPPGNPGRLSEAISYLLENPEMASKMGEGGHKRLTEKYSVDATIPKIIKVYESLTGN